MTTQQRRHTKCVVQTSGGVASWACATRAIERFGAENVTLLFADTLMEDEDLYRFLEDTEAHLGIKVTRIAEGRTPWEVFNDVKFLGNSRVDPCSMHLKRVLLKKWMMENADPETTCVAVGIDWTETHRIGRIGEGMAPFDVIFPLIESETDKVEIFRELESAGIKRPRLYDMGFPHNNCGGFCIKAGISQFVALRRQMPERFDYHMNQEAALREKLGKNVAILTDRRNKSKIPMPLSVLAERMDAGEKFPGDEWGACGCALSDSSSDLTTSIAEALNED